MKRNVSGVYLFDSEFAWVRALAANSGWPVSEVNSFLLRKAMKDFAFESKEQLNKEIAESQAAAFIAEKTVEIK